MDVGGWLRGLGLGQFEATFRESEIDFDVLPELTEPDLEKLGVPLGHRKRLLEAIASLGATAALGPAPAQPPTAQAIAPPTPEMAGERRHRTVMFCDLVEFDSVGCPPVVEGGAGGERRPDKLQLGRAIPPHRAVPRCRSSPLLAPPNPPLPHRRTHPEPSLSHPEAYSQRGYAGRPDRQSSSASRVTAGAAGFFTLIQFALRPER